MDDVSSFLLPKLAIIFLDSSAIYREALSWALASALLPLSASGCFCLSLSLPNHNMSSIFLKGPFFRLVYNPSRCENSYSLLKKWFHNLYFSLSDWPFLHLVQITELLLYWATLSPLNFKNAFLCQILFRRVSRIIWLYVEHWHPTGSLK